MEHAYIYALAIAIIPVLTEWLKKASWIPARLVPIIPVAMGLLTSVVVNMQSGMDWWSAIMAGLGIGAGATQLRQIATKSLKAPTS